MSCRRQHISCIGNKIVVSLLPVCCWIQRDTSRPWQKWIVIFVAEMQSTCIPNKQLVSGNMCPSTYPDTSCSSGTHVAGQHVVGVNAALLDCAMVALYLLICEINYFWTTKHSTGSKFYHHKYPLGYVYPLLKYRILPRGSYYAIRCILN